MVFLFVFGNAVCAKVGNLWYPLLYIVAGLAAAATHNLTGGGLALGASGAINGMVGFFVVYYPINEISCWWWFWVRTGTFSISSVWMIFLWFAFDIWGAMGDASVVAYAAHLGGFVAGFGIATALLLSVLPTDKYERSLFDALRGNTR